MQGIEFTTRFGATVEVTPDDFIRLREAGNAYFAELLRSVEESADRVKPHLVKQARVEIQQGNAVWDSLFGLVETVAETPDYLVTQRLVASCLEAGYGMVTCASCEDAHSSRGLTVEESRMDGIYRWRFYCPEGHILWITGENVMGEMSENEFDWRRIERPAPWATIPAWKLRKWRGEPVWSR